MATAEETVSNPKQFVEGYITFCKLRDWIIYEYYRRTFWQIEE